MHCHGKVSYFTVTRKPTNICQHIKQLHTYLFLVFHLKCWQVVIDCQYKITLH